MPDSPIIVGQPERAARPVAVHPGVWLRLATVLGTALALVGAADLILLWFPLQIGVTEYEFATISRFLSSLPVLTVGLGLLALVGIAGDRKSIRILVAIVSALILVIVVVSMVLFVLDIPIALKSVPPGELLLGIKKAIVKALVDGTVFSVAYGYLVWATARR